jgi:hypothetical protein
MADQLSWGVWFPFGNDPGNKSVLFIAPDRETRFTGNGSDNRQAVQDLLKILRMRDHEDWAVAVEDHFGWLLGTK